jgi:hypothetical protein
MKDPTVSTALILLFILLFWIFIINPVSALVLMLLWNNILVPLVHVGVIGFWQSLGLVLLLSFVSSFFRSSN